MAFIMVLGNTKNANKWREGFRLRPPSNNVRNSLKSENVVVFSTVFIYLQVLKKGDRLTGTREGERSQEYSWRNVLDQKHRNIFCKPNCKNIHAWYNGKPATLWGSNKGFIPIFVTNTSSDVNESQPQGPLTTFKEPANHFFENQSAPLPPPLEGGHSGPQKGEKSMNIRQYFQGKNILALSALGGHLHAVNYPPPRVLWPLRYDFFVTFFPSKTSRFFRNQSFLQKKSATSETKFRSF